MLFRSPKIENTVSQCYHVNQDLPYGVDNGWGVKSKMISAKSIYKIFLPKTTLLDKYNGWHTVALEWTPLEYIFYVDGKITTRENYTEVPVTTVPLKIIISGEFRDPKGSEKPFYGWLKDASYPDKFIVDYVRVYNEDFGGRTAPKVTLTPVGHINGIKSGKPVKFRVKAEDKDGIVKALYLFSKGRIRAEINVNSADAE